MRFLFLVVVVFLASTSKISAQTSASLVGTWKLVSGKMTRNDSTRNYGSNTANSIKIVTPTHFAVFSNSTADTSFNQALAGTIKVDGKNYIETISHGSVKVALGKIMNYTYELNGDKWQIAGGGAGYTFEETWERVK